jgi:hypothetical protein
MTDQIKAAAAPQRDVNQELETLHRHLKEAKDAKDSLLAMAQGELRPGPAHDEAINVLLGAYELQIFFIRKHIRQISHDLMEARDADQV